MLPSNKITQTLHLIVYLLSEDNNLNLGFCGEVYEFKRFLDRLNDDDDAIDVPHEDAQAILGDNNDPFTSISMSKDFVDKNIAANDAY
ncbi:hypothetical protein Tco_0884794 [Tanacetum coccineum]